MPGMTDPRSASTITLGKLLFPELNRARLVAWGSVLLLLVIALWRSPVSPFALDRADALLLSGHTQSALAHLDAASRYNPLPGVRDDALMRAAMGWAIDGADDVQARARLLRLIRKPGVSPELRAEAWERLGHLQLTRFDAAEDASSAYRQAFDAAPDAPRADVRLMDAARARLEAGDADGAHHLWERVARRYPAHRARAYIAQAAILFGKGKMHSALDRYEAALKAAEDDASLQVAKLGVAACNDRMGRIEAALAEIEASGIPGDLGDAGGGDSGGAGSSGSPF